MPELPEVETVVRGLRPDLIGRTVTGFWYDWPRTIGAPSPDDLANRVLGQTVERIDRRAKYIVCSLTHDLLIVHLKMTGRLYVAPAGATLPDDRWVHAKFGLDDGRELRFSDARKFGKVYLARTLAEVSAGAAKLGPEPLDDSFTPAHFLERLRGRGGALKALLLDQSFIAGVGNIYADEALFRAGLYPLRKANSLSDDEAVRLYHTIREALTLGLDHEGATIGWYRKPDGSMGESQLHFLAYGRDGQPCVVCGTILHKTRVAQRGTHFCPVCQPLLE
jgi:formamidopyrimidine-DNA glycosylase